MAVRTAMRATSVCSILFILILYSLGLLGEELYQLSNGPSSVADSVLGFRIHLGKGQPACFVGCKDGVVSESLFTHLLFQNLSLDDSVEDIFLAVHAECYGRMELSPSG